MISTFTGLKISTTAGGPRGKKLKFMTVASTIVRVSLLPSIKGAGAAPALKKLLHGPWKDATSGLSTISVRFTEPVEIKRYRRESLLR